MERWFELEGPLQTFYPESSLNCSDDSLKWFLMAKNGSIKCVLLFMIVGVDWIPPGAPSAAFGIALSLLSPGGASG